MRSPQLFEEGVLEEEEAAAGKGELNLGLGSLIAIFFGLALVCGVFFGFGYMMGHRKPAVDASTETTSSGAKILPSAPKPSAQIAQQASDPSRVVVPSTSAEATQPPAIGTPDASAESPRAASLTPAPNPESPDRTPDRTVAAASPKPVAPAPVPVAATGSIMVQIAAVKNRPDAEALAAALEKNGFTPTIRTEPQDKLLHVQVGPFGSRDDAKAMRQRLANAGYNAFIK